MNKNYDALANEKITPQDRFHTCSSLKTNQPSNSRSSSPIQKENPENSASELPIFNENPDVKSSNYEIKIHGARPEVITRNEESVLAKGVWSLFNKTNNIFVEKPSHRLDKKTQKTISLNVLSKRKISEDNGNKRPLKDITKQVLPSISQLETPIQRMFKSLYISPNINVSEGENNNYLEPGSNIHEIPDIIQIDKHIVRDSDEKSEDKENENAGSLEPSDLNFSIDSFNTKYAEIIYSPSYYVDLLDDPEAGVTLHDFHMLLNNYTILWNHKNDH